MRRDTIRQKEIQVRINKLETALSEHELAKLKLMAKVDTIDKEIELQIEAINKVKQEIDNGSE